MLQKTIGSSDLWGQEVYPSEDRKHFQVLVITEGERL